MRYGYKEIIPEETIKNIKRFFEVDKKCVLKELNNEQTESGSWWNNFELLYQGNIVGRSNGKGASQIYAEASGLAEMYERFCSLINSVFTIYPVNKVYKNINFSKYKYYIDPEEKKVSYQEAIKASPRIYHLFKEIDDGKGNAEKYWSMLFNNNIIAVPYKNFNNLNNHKHFVPEFILAATGSDGMAAGNTFEEACVQGSSEVCEHYVWHNLNNQRDYKVIDLKQLELPSYLTDMIINVEKKGYKLICYDFSYHYGVPVLGLLIADTEDKVCYLNLGSHPVFEVALERTITEIYQGNVSFKNRTKKVMLPYSLYGDAKAQLSDMSSVTQRKIYNENIYYNIDIISKINTEVFLTNSSNYSNIDFYNYYCDLFVKLQWNVYVKDWSLSKDIYMVHVFVNNILTLGAITETFLAELTLNEKTNIYKTLIRSFQQTENILNYGVTNDTYINQFDDFLTENTNYKKFITIFLNTDLFHLYYKNKFSKYDFEKIFQSINYLDMFLSTPQITCEFSKFLYDFLKHYQILITYGFYAKEPREKIEQIANFYQVNYTYEDYENMYDKDYYYYKIQQIIWKEYRSQSYYDYISLFIKE